MLTEFVERTSRVPQIEQRTSFREICTQWALMEFNSRLSCFAVTKLNRFASSRIAFRCLRVDVSEEQRGVYDEQINKSGVGSGFG